ncbi:ribonuclease HII [Bacillus fonticola]|uniref:ribonuclease HII n=1 Tax=Bacillus fonticola TaxID=2728853 RepID=UPI001475E70B|nr:ribonuclease HII [Bacillus fonticola]
MNSIRTIQQWKQIFQEMKTMEDDRYAEAVQDPRKGVQQLLRQWQKQQEKEQRLHERWLEMNTYERAIRKKGATYIAGVDEAGRGPIAGPVVTAAVMLREDAYLPGVDDSKAITAHMRDYYYERILEQAICTAIEVVPTTVIDEINIYEATKQGMKQAIESLSPTPQIALIDAVPLQLEAVQTESIIKGDAKSVTIAAASILAKVTRDRYMASLHEQYPQYGFASHKGYGTKEHVEALDRYGVIHEHRRSFQPVKTREQMTLL